MEVDTANGSVVFFEAVDYGAYAVVPPYERDMKGVRDGGERGDLIIAHVFTQNEPVPHLH